MLTIVTFFKPTKTKLVFLVEWTLFILIIAGQGGLKRTTKSWQQVIL